MAIRDYKRCNFRKISIFENLVPVHEVRFHTPFDFRRSGQRKLFMGHCPLLVFDAYFTVTACCQKLQTRTWFSIEAVNSSEIVCISVFSDKKYTFLVWCDTMGRYYHEAKPSPICSSLSTIEFSYKNWLSAWRNILWGCTPMSACRLDFVHRSKRWYN